MPQTEILIHIVLDGEHALDYDTQTEIHGAALSALVNALGGEGGVTIARNGIEVRPLPDPPPVAADAAQASAPAPVEAAPAADPTVAAPTPTADPVVAPAPGHSAQSHRPTT